MSSRAEVGTTIGVLTKDDGEDNTDSGPVASNGKERESEHTVTKGREEDTDIRDDAFLDSEEGGLKFKWGSYYSELRRRGRCRRCADARVKAAPVVQEKQKNAKKNC